MKITTALLLIVLMSSATLSQDASIENAFSRDRRKLSVTRFVVGEDATSGFYYFVYKSRSQVRKIRSVWNGGCCQDPTVEDFYFKDGDPVLYVRLSGQRKQLGQLLKGRNTLLRTDERIYLEKSRLIMWIENGKTIPSSDPRWKDKEKSVVEEFKGQLENYRWYLDGKI